MVCFPVPYMHVAFHHWRNKKKEKEKREKTAKS
jgi:hypothetical protein